MDPPLQDRTYARFIDFIYNRFAHSRPSASANAPPRCEFQDFFAVADPPSAARHNLTVYPGVLEIVDFSAEMASWLARESRPLHCVVPLRWKMFFVGDNPNYCNAWFVNQSDPALFDKNISSLSAALASQTMMGAGVTDFVSAKRRDSCFGSHRLSDLGMG